MPITKNDIEKFFQIGSIIASGGGRKYYKITEILNDRIKIQPTEAKTPSRLNYDKLSIVIDNLHLIDPEKIEASVGELLKSNNLQDTQNESYLYGFAKEFISRKQITPNDYVQIELEKAVEKSLNDDPNERKRRLASAPQRPSKIVVSTYAFQRNPDVIAEVLDRAKGVCEECGNPAPFRRKKDDTPYLEVHHIIPLSEDGLDVAHNAKALCPNCHRKAHFG